MFISQQIIDIKYADIEINGHRLKQKFKKLKYFFALSLNVFILFTMVMNPSDYGVFSHKSICSGNCQAYKYKNFKMRKYEEKVLKPLFIQRLKS